MTKNEKWDERNIRHKRRNPLICLYLRFSFFSPASVEKWNCTWKISSVKDRSSTLDLRTGLVPLWCDSNIFRTHLREITLTQGHSISIRTVSSYRTRAIITRGLYTFYPLFKVPKTFFQGAFFLKFWPYVWLVFKSGL